MNDDFLFVVTDGNKDGFLVELHRTDRGLIESDFLSETEYSNIAQSPYLAIIEICQRLQKEYEAEQQQARDKRRIAQAFVANGLKVPEAYR